MASDGSIDHDDGTFEPNAENAAPASNLAASTERPVQIPLSDNVNLQGDRYGVSLGVNTNEDGDSVRVGIATDSNRVAPELFHHKVFEEGTILRTGILSNQIGDLNEGGIDFREDKFSHHYDSENIAGVQAYRRLIDGENTLDMEVTTGINFDGDPHLNAGMTYTQHLGEWDVASGVEASRFQDETRVDLRTTATRDFDIDGREAQVSAGAQGTYSDITGTSFTAAADLDVRWGTEGSWAERISSNFNVAAQTGAEERVEVGAGIYHDIAEMGRLGLEATHDITNDSTSVGPSFRIDF